MTPPSTSARAAFGAYVANRQNRGREPPDCLRVKRPRNLGSGKYTGCLGVVESNVFQENDYPDEYSPGYDVVLDSEEVVTVRWDQLAG